MTYVFTDNTYSVGKSNFWTYAQQLFSLPVPLAADMGLTGRGLAGTMSLAGDHFVAEGIPLTEYSDSAPTIPDPYQKAVLTARSSTTSPTPTIVAISVKACCVSVYNLTNLASSPCALASTGNVSELATFVNTMFGVIASVNATE